jgi:hypothetical protein
MFLEKLVEGLMLKRRQFAFHQNLHNRPRQFTHLVDAPTLEGLRVIEDHTGTFAGPFCTMILSDLGAEVIKIEKPDGGDETDTIQRN